MKLIPIKAAQELAEEYGYSQVVVIARAVGEGGGEHVTTYGVDKANCDVAARIGHFFKHKLMGWPEPQPLKDKLADVAAIVARVEPTICETFSFGRDAETRTEGRILRADFERLIEIARDGIRG